MMLSGDATWRALPGARCLLRFEGLCCGDAFMDWELWDGKEENTGREKRPANVFAPARWTHLLASFEINAAE